MKSSNLDHTLDLLMSLLEVGAIIRSAIATWTVVSSVTHGDLSYTIFTVVTIEGVFLVSLFSMHRHAVAPITALLALAFAGVMQYSELRVIEGTLSTWESDILRGAVAFSPVVVLGMAYLHNLTQAHLSGASLLDSISGLWRGLTQQNTETVTHNAMAMGVEPLDGEGAEKRAPFVPAHTRKPRSKSAA